MDYEKLPWYLTVKQAAEILQVHPNTLYKFIHAGMFQGAYKVGRAWRIPTKDLLCLNE